MLSHGGSSCAERDAQSQAAEINDSRRIGSVRVYNYAKAVMCKAAYRKLKKNEASSSAALERAEEEPVTLSNCSATLALSPEGLRNERRGMPRFPVAMGGESVGVVRLDVFRRKRSACTRLRLRLKGGGIDRLHGRSPAPVESAPRENTTHNKPGRARQDPPFHTILNMLSALRRSTRARVPKVGLGWWCRVADVLRG